MGVKYGRKYADIIQDLSAAIAQLDEIFEFFDMRLEQWQELGDADRLEIIRTASDDIFYALGESPHLSIGSGTVSHDAANHVIKVGNGDNLITVVYLT